MVVRLAEIEIKIADGGGCLGWATTVTVLVFTVGWGALCY